MRKFICRWIIEAGIWIACQGIAESVVGIDESEVLPAAMTLSSNLYQKKPI